MGFYQNLKYPSKTRGHQVMVNILLSGGFFHIFCHFNLLQWGFVYDFQCSDVGLLLSDKGSTCFSEYTLGVFDPSSHCTIFFLPIHITYMYDFWDFPCLFKVFRDISMLFDAQILIRVLCCVPSWIRVLETFYNIYIIGIRCYVWKLLLYLGESPAVLVMLFIFSL